MNIFEEDFRRIGTRNIILSQAQMENFRIKKIYNSFGAPDYLNDEDAAQMLSNFIERGEICLLEASNNGEIYKITLITFEDIWSRNVFALQNMDFYEGCPDLISLYN